MQVNPLPLPPDSAFELQNLCDYFCSRSPMPMVAVEGSTSIVRHVNSAFMLMAGVDPDECIGRPFAEVVPEGVENGCSALIERVFRTGVSESLVEQQHRSDPPVCWSYVAWAVLGDDQVPVGVMIQVVDSTEYVMFRKKAASMNETLLVSSIRQQELTERSNVLNEELESAIREKEYFIAVLSHELRTPLAPVLLAASILSRDSRLETDTRGMMQMINRNVTLEARLIDDLLDMTRMDRGKLKLDRCAVDLRSILERAIEGCADDIEAGELTLKVRTGRRPQIVNGDAARLQQVFSNLLRNAVKFTPPGGTIRLRSRVHGTACEVTVADTGAGMDADFIPQAFTAFEQGDRNSTRKAGFGLGLAICKTIVDLHQGELTAYSPGKDQGATFTVRLPVLPIFRSVPEQSTSAAAPNQTRPLRILLVEDHADTAKIMQRLLTSDGHTVEWAGDVAAGLKLAAGNQFDLLLSDLGLPDGSGVDLMRALRDSGSDLPGIVLSGYGQEHDFVRSREAGFSAHLIKPLTPQRLNDAIAEVIK